MARIQQTSDNITKTKQKPRNKNKEKKTNKQKNNQKKRKINEQHEKCKTYVFWKLSSLLFLC